MLQTTDSLFPTGAYAHSYGLEGAVEDGYINDPDTFKTYLMKIILPAMIHLELPSVAQAFEAAKSLDSSKITLLDELYGAMKVTVEIRTASERIGTQRLSLLQTLMPHPFLNKLDNLKNQGDFQAHEAIVLGIQGALSGADKRHTMIAAYYLGLSMQANAVFKLIRIGQIQCQSIVASCLSKTDEVIENALKVSMEDIGWFSPSLDICSARHESAYSRIFIS